MIPNILPVKRTNNMRMASTKAGTGCYCGTSCECPTACEGDTCCNIEGMTMTTAMVQRPAPIFTAEAYVNGTVKTIKLSEYRGKDTFLNKFYR